MALVLRGRQQHGGWRRGGCRLVGDLVGAPTARHMWRSWPSG